VFQQNFGYRDCALAKPVDDETMFYIASSTKPLLAAAVLKLADEHRIDLNAPVKKYLPRFTLADPAEAETITVGDLLSHGRGLNEFVITIGEAFTGEMDDDKFYRLLKTVHAKGHFSYSNLHYTLLGRVIESVTGESWKAYIQSAIFEPLGMRHTTTSATRWLADADHACPLEYWNGSLQESLAVKTDLTMHAAGGIASTAPDLARFLQMEMSGGVLNNKRILSAKLVHESQKAHATTDANYFTYHRSAYGYGWYIGEYRGETLLHHFGGFDGAHAHLSWLPSQQIGVVVLENFDGPATDFAELVANSVYDSVLHVDSEQEWKKFQSEVAETGQKAKNHPGLLTGQLGQRVSTVAGTYLNKDWGTLVLAHDGDHVTARMGEYPLHLSTNTDGAPIAMIEGRWFEIAFSGTDGKITSVDLHSGHMDLMFERQGH
jgi:CubicO group peptidase (beta-lactamase class C family)